VSDGTSARSLACGGLVGCTDGSQAYEATALMTTPKPHLTSLSAFVDVEILSTPPALRANVHAHRYVFVADDLPRAGPSVASTVPNAVLDGWLTLSFGARTNVYGRAHARSQPRYCVLGRHGRSHVLHYFRTDYAHRPLGFVNLQRSDTYQYVVAPPS
jgi:hypothetical protein